MRWKKYKWDAPYYLHNREARRAIRFISKANEKRGWGKELKPKSNSISVVVHEHFLYYFVETNSSSAYGFYKVHKLTRRVYAEGHKHKVVEKEEE